MLVELCLVQVREAHFGDPGHGSPRLSCGLSCTKITLLLCITPSSVWRGVRTLLTPACHEHTRRTPPLVRVGSALIVRHQNVQEHDGRGICM
jgi:hypothetical protein